MAQKDIQNEESRPTNPFQQLPFFYVVYGLMRYKLLKKDFTIGVFFLVAVTGDNSQGISR